MRRMRFLGGLTVIEALVVAAIAILATTFFLGLISSSPPARPTAPESTLPASTSGKPDYQ